MPSETPLAALRSAIFQPEAEEHQPVRPFWCNASVTARHAGIVPSPAKPLVQSVEGTPEVVAAWLRAVADQLDPPKRPTR